MRGPSFGNYDRVRIAIIASPWLAVPPTGYGGTESVLDALAQHLAKQDHDVLLYTTGDSTCPVERAWTYEQAIGTNGSQVATELAHVIDAYRTASEWGAEVVHDHTLCGPVFARGLVHVPVVTTNHGPFDGELQTLYRSVGGDVPIIAISHHQASTARDIPVATVIHHGMEMPALQSDVGTRTHALFLGRMCEEKGVDVAIRVARNAEIPLRIAAKMQEPPERAYFDERVKPLLGQDVEYLGEADTDDKMQLLSESICLLNPIDWPEPFGMVMLEALSCGTPVVATDMGAAAEIVDHGVTGFLANDERSLVDALGQVRSLDRSACRSAAEARFSAARMAEDHARFYAQVLTRPRHRAA